jgi:hypothetical protein
MAKNANTAVTTLQRLAPLAAAHAEGPPARPGRLAITAGEWSQLPIKLWFRACVRNKAVAIWHRYLGQGLSIDRI